MFGNKLCNSVSGIEKSANLRFKKKKKKKGGEREKEKKKTITTPHSSAKGKNLEQREV